MEITKHVDNVKINLSMIIKELIDTLNENRESNIAIDHHYTNNK